VAQEIPEQPNNLDHVHKLDMTLQEKWLFSTKIYLRNMIHT